MPNKFNLKDLDKEMPYKWRVQSFSKYKEQATCIPYVDARDVMAVLDDVVGAENWAKDYKEVLGMLFGGVGIKIDGEWIWKWDLGTETKKDPKKGLVSDCLKRAAVGWGVSRRYYKMKPVYVKANEVKTEHNKPYVVDNQGNRVWDLTKHINDLSVKKPYQPTPKAPFKPKPKEPFKPKTEGDKPETGVYDTVALQVDLNELTGGVYAGKYAELGEDWKERVTFLVKADPETVKVNDVKKAIATLKTTYATKTKGTNGINEKQIKRLYAIAKGAGAGEEQIHSYQAEHFHIESTKDLNREQYDEICQWFEEQKVAF